MSNKAKNSKESILCDAKELMKLYDRVTWHLPKARREHSAVRRFEDAGYAIIHDCTIAMELKGENEQQRKREYIEHLIGSFGEMLAAFDILMDMKDMTQKKSDTGSKHEMYLFSDSAKLAIARLLELRDKVSPEWWQWLEWDSKRKCITYKQGYSPNERLNNKYHLKLKRYETIRNHRAQERSVQRAKHAGVAA